MPETLVIAFAAIGLFVTGFLAVVLPVLVFTAVADNRRMNALVENIRLRKFHEIPPRDFLVAEKRYPNEMSRIREDLERSGGWSNEI